MDKLEELFALQKQLNMKCGVDTDAMQIGPKEESDVIKQMWVQQFQRALTQEASELLDCTCWKWWARYQRFDEQNARVEVVDLFHFVISLAQVLGMSAEDVFQAYLKKHEVNNQRQDSGYTEKTDDCRHI